MTNTCSRVAIVTGGSRGIGRAAALSRNQGNHAVTDRCSGAGAEPFGNLGVSRGRHHRQGKELAMASLPSIQGRAGPVSPDVLDLHVTAHGTDTRVVTVGGEIDALTAPELGTLLTAQLAAAPLVVVDLERVRFLGSPGLSVLFAANELATRENRYLWLVFAHRGMVNRALEVTGLGEQFNVAETMAAALINSP